MFKKLEYLELEFEGDRRILLTCVISTIEAKRLLYKGCEAHLAHMIDKSSSEITLDSVLVMHEFSNVLSELGLLVDKEIEFGIKLLSVQLSCLYHSIG